MDSEKIDNEDAFLEDVRSSLSQLCNQSRVPIIKCTFYDHFNKLEKWITIRLENFSKKYLEEKMKECYIDENFCSFVKIELDGEDYDKWKHLLDSESEINAKKKLVADKLHNDKISFIIDNLFIPKEIISDKNIDILYKSSEKVLKDKIDYAEKVYENYKNQVLDIFDDSYK